MRRLFLLSFLLYTCTVSAQTICRQDGPKPDECPDTNRWDNINCKWICETTTLPPTPTGVPGVCVTNEGGYVSAGARYRYQCNHCTCPDADGTGGMCTLIGCSGKCWDNNGTAYQVNQTRQAADDGCCTCGDNGKWSCTKMACPKTTIPATPTPVPHVCVTNEGGYVSGESYRCKCDHCTCPADGSAGITTLMGCSGTCWDNNGKGYHVNQTRQAKDGGCCTCQENGKWACTNMTCSETTLPPTPTAIPGVCVTNEGGYVSAGQAYKDKCNSCICPAANGTGGMCTLMGCGAGKCWDNNGTSYQTNQTRQDKDGGCCTCSENGQWTCTNMTCLEVNIKKHIYTSSAVRSLSIYLSLTLCLSVCISSLFLTS